MTKKDYELIASVIKQTNESFCSPSIAALARAMASKLAAENPRFDATRFLKACGIN